MFCRVNLCQPFLSKFCLKQSSETLFWSFVFDLWKENHHPVLTQSILRHLASSYFGHNGHMCFLFIWAAAADALWAVSICLELVVYCGGWKSTFVLEMMSISQKCVHFQLTNKKDTFIKSSIESEIISWQHNLDTYIMQVSFYDHLKYKTRYRLSNISY